MHLEILKYLTKFEHLAGERNLDVGSLNVNGSSRAVFPISVGVDIREGMGVDLVCSGEDLPKHFKDEEFDLVVSTETLEHVRHWREFTKGIWQVLKTDGHFICTLASTKKERHDHPDDYWRLRENHIEAIFKDQEIVDVNPRIGKISFGFVVKKKKPLVELGDVHLLPIDDQVSKELLKQ